MFITVKIFKLLKFSVVDLSFNCIWYGYYRPPYLEISTEVDFEHIIKNPWHSKQDSQY